MQRRAKIIIGTAALVAAAAALGTGIAIAGSDDGAGSPITGEDLVTAKAAALEYTHGGRVTGTEVGDEESLYEVEVTKIDGSQVDVQLDKEFKVVGDKEDQDSTEESD